jgi:hypothetical protein
MATAVPIAIASEAPSEEVPTEPAPETQASMIAARAR